ncbi:MAG TPA: NAD(P)H-binding protein [Burkholderiaceae bacterium]|nr:NAD(P)H-binding protein [Burkholderiaceae bacterium]
MITVMGATGHTGRQIVEILLGAGEPVRALARTESKLAPLARAGAEALAGDAADTTFLARAFRGARAVYTLLPTDRAAPDYRAEQDRQGEAIVGAVRASGVRYVVALSSVGADLSEGTGVIAGLHAQEERLRELADTNVLLLRPVSFFENFYDMLPLIKQEGIIVDSVAPTLAVPMVATRDVAAVAAQALRRRDWTGVAVRELLGPGDLSYAEATRILGEGIGKPDLAYVPLPYGEMVRALTEAGLSASFATLYVAMTRAFNDGRVKPHGGRSAANTTPTRFEDFAVEFAHAYHAAPSAAAVD